MSWDLNVLRQTIEQLYGAEHLAKLSPCLNSIVERQEFSRFYYHESKETLEKILYDKTDQASLLRLVLPFDSEEREIFEDCKFIARAHILSCIQNMHSMSDILGHVIYYSLNIGKAKKESDISLKCVNDWINGDCELDFLKVTLDEFTKHNDYEYLSALVNHSKHRSIIEPYFNVNLLKKGRDMQEIRFRGFKFKGMEYPSRIVHEFLGSEIDRESILVIKIGNEVNRIVQNVANKALQRTSR